MNNENKKHFEPKDHLITIKNRGGAAEYLPVQWRLVWFRQLCPEGEITTELVHLDVDKETEEETSVWKNGRSEKVVKTAKGIAVFRATVKDGKGGIATGTKMEKAASFPDWLEKAETGSIGRALAALGYGTQFAPELNEGHRIVDSPVDDAPTTRQNEQQGADDEDLHRLLGDVKKLAVECGIKDRAAWQSLVADVFEVYIPEQKLTKAQIIKLRGEVITRKQAA